MSRNLTTRAWRWGAAAGVAALSVLGSVEGASATTPPTDAEDYPPAETVPPEDPGELPATGADGTGDWLRVGTATVLGGGLLVAVASRRRRHDTPPV